MIRLGTDDEFRVVRDFLRKEFTEEMLVAELGVPALERFRERPPGRPLRNLLARVLFGGAAAARAEIEEITGPAVFGALASLGLLEPHGDAFISSVLLYPVGGAIIASDRVVRPDGTLIDDPDREIVFLALTNNSQVFLKMLPRTRCDAMLDLGAGSGAAALSLAHTAREIWATDISERSTFFAEFNRRLNAVENVHALQGSVYEPVAGLTFDRIVTHPPYDPSTASRWTFSDGGDDGEGVVRSIVSQLPTYLRPGGQLFLLARGADRRGQPFETRLREWLGDAHEEFDICAVVRDVNLPEEYAFGAVITTSRNFDDYEAHLKRFRQLEVEDLAYCNILIQRHLKPAEPLTIRRQLGSACTAEILEGALSLERELPSLPVFDRKLRTSAACELHTQHVMAEGELTPKSYSLRIKAPFSNELPCPEWVARLLASCTGKYTGRQIYEYIRKDDSIPEGDFEAALKRLISAGGVEVSQ